MNIAILSYSSANYKSNRKIIEAGKKRNHKVVVLNPKNLVLYLSDKEGQSRIYTNENGILRRLPKIDAIIPRVATNISHCASIIDFFTNNLGVYSTQSGESIKICSSKWLTLLKANEFGIKVPKTFYSSEFNSENLDTFVDSLGLPLILKLNRGSQGIGVMKFSDKTSLKTTAETLSKQGTSFLLQEMIKSKGNGNRQVDFRTIVIGQSDCIVTMRKTANNSKEFRSNLARKGIAEPYELSEIERQFCLKVARTIDSDIVGLDWMKADDKSSPNLSSPILLENNSNMGVKIIEVVGKNFFEDLFFHIEVAIQDFKKSKTEKDTNKKQSNLLFQEIETLKKELTKKENIINEVFSNQKLKMLFSTLKGKQLGYIDSEKKEKKIKIIKPKQIIEMMLDMIEIEK
jgi:ribosomal protein S6--L-glutamate ligase